LTTSLTSGIETLRFVSPGAKDTVVCTAVSLDRSHPADHDGGAAAPSLTE
jgi:hypothetical protein